MDSQEVGRIRQQYLAALWPRFLEQVSIAGLRGWSGQSVRFAFPVTAVVGENGTGKSTVLKAAACAYHNELAGRTYYPSSFFVETHWDPISQVTLEYRVKQGTETITFKSRKPSRRWSMSELRPRRNVLFFDISRTLPLDASAGYAKVAKLAAEEISTTDIRDEYRERLSFILSREYSRARFAVSDVDERREVGLLTREFGEVSQFHQGAGEDTTLDLMRSLQSIPDTSLLIIDEVEASLHPRAQRRLVQFLLWLSRNKRVQVILSTHSPYVLEELPEEARILLLPGTDGPNVIYGASPDFALSRIDENVHPELHIFVEDREAEVMTREILAASPEGQGLLARIAIVPVGPANVVELMGRLSNENRLPYRSIGVADGDQAAAPGCVLLPGGRAPERVVFEQLRDADWPELPQRFGVGAGDLLAYLEDAMLDPDHHNWTTRVGDRIIKSKYGVWETLTNQWCRSCLRPEDKASFTTRIRDLLTG